jgi:DNA-binding NarL/FixJ family response regulator
VSGAPRPPTNGSPAEARPPLRLALVDDYEVVLVGLAHMFAAYRDRVEVVEIDAGSPVSTHVDVALFDTFAQREADGPELDVLVANGHADHVVVYTWSFDEQLIEIALRKGASGYLSKTLTASELVVALEQICDGEIVVRRPAAGRRATVGLDWPGRTEGLTDREAEVIALITQGKTNAEIAAITFLSLNTVKGYVRNAFRKLGVRSRTEAAVWGVAHGFHVDAHRVDSWR